jgi:hypothetical protein
MSTTPLIHCVEFLDQTQEWMMERFSRALDELGAADEAARE